MAVPSVVGEMRREHEALRRQVTSLEGMVQAHAQGPAAAAPGPVRELRECLERLGAALEVHLLREEEALFPEVQGLASKGVPGAGIIGQFFREEAEDDIMAHDVLRVRVGELRALLAEASGTGTTAEDWAHRFEARFRLFRTLLELHAAKEDELVFPVIDRALRPTARA